MRYACPLGCGWPGSDSHADWMAHRCQVPAQSLFDRSEVALERQRALPNAPAIAKAVDDWLLMERKARAWDEAVAYFNKWPSLQEYVERLDDIWTAVHPADPDSKR